MKSILRWIGILPAAFAAMLVSYVIYYLLNTVFNYTKSTEWIIKIAANFISGISFVFAGSFVAPCGRKIVSVVLTTIVTSVCIASVAGSFWMYDNTGIVWQIIYCASTAIGGISACVSVYREED